MTKEIAQIEFPCTQPPADGPAARLIGLYPQRQPGLWMQRVKVLGGRMTGAQWCALGRIAQRFTPSTPLHLTTRQDVEFHNLSPEVLPAAQAAIAEAGLSAVGAGGDTIRNITVCACSGARSGSVDLMPLAGSIQRLLEGTEGIYALPRKFKIALACSDACGQPWLHDLALVARRREGRWGLQVVGAGSMGARPATGIVWFDWLPASDVLPLVAGAVDLFATHGDRANRALARLRHVRQRVGDQAFLVLVRQALERAQKRDSWPEVYLEETAQGFEASVTLTFLNGDLHPPAAEALGDLAERDDVRVRIAPQHRVVVFGRSNDLLHERLAAHEVLAKPSQPAPAIVACPGKTWCRRGLTDTRRLAERLAREWADLPPGLTVAISGCPNGCAHSAVADIGLVGRIVTHEGAKREAFDLRVGGGMGRNDRLATLVAKGLDLFGDIEPPLPSA